MNRNNAVIFCAWGEGFIEEAISSIKKSNQFLVDYDLILITDRDTDISQFTTHFTEVIGADFKCSGLLRKTEIFKYIPDRYRSFLLLDSDTVIVKDLSLGFAKAEMHGIAIAPAPHYSLGAFWGFDKIMDRCGMEDLGQLQYNTGVIFSKIAPETIEVFELWHDLATKYSDFENDQPFFTMAMELLNFNPYTLSISFNYRGFGEGISGDVHIWHSRDKMPQNINHYSVSWPLRRVWPSSSNQTDC